jgi:hypothetical protein
MTKQEVQDVFFSADYRYLITLINKKERTHGTVYSEVVKRFDKLKRFDRVEMKRELAKIRPGISKALFPQDWPKNGRSQWSFLWRIKAYLKRRAITKRERISDNFLLANRCR